MTSDINRRDALKLVAGTAAGTATIAYLTDNVGAARGTLPDEATRRKMAAMVDG